MPAVIGIIFSTDRKRVVVLQRNDINMWVLPGGGIDHEESPEHAIIREVQEETGLLVRIKRKVGEYRPANRLTHFTYLFECEVISGELQTGPETRAIDYFPLDRLPKRFFFLHHYWLDEAIKGDPQVIQGMITQINWRTVIRFFLRYPFTFAKFLFLKFKRRKSNQ